MSNILPLELRYIQKFFWQKEMSNDTNAMNEVLLYISRMQPGLPQAFVYVEERTSLSGTPHRFATASIKPQRAHLTLYYKLRKSSEYQTPSHYESETVQINMYIT